MKHNLLVVLLGASLLVTGCDQTQKKTTSAEAVKSQKESTIKPAAQGDINQIANELQVKYSLITNIPTNKCDQTKANKACFEVELSLTAKQAITVNNWQIYLSQISPIQSSISDEFSVKHVNGDLHQITLSSNFKGFSKGETKLLRFRANFWMLSQTDALPNYIVATAQEGSSIEPKVIESTKIAIDSDTGLEVLPYVVDLTDEKKHFKRSEIDKTQWLNNQTLFVRNEKSLSQVKENSNNVIANVIIPTPKSIEIDKNNEKLSIKNGIAVNWGNVQAQEVSAAFDRLAILGLKSHHLGVPLILKITPNESAKIGAYQLNITENVINITGVDSTGVFNGLQSLASLITLGSNELPLLSIEDEPHYEFRGMLVDVARNFHSKAFILKLLDQMSAYKLNKLHLHMGDDEGWRLEIPGFPELVETSSQRCFDKNEQHCLMPQLGAGLNTNNSVNGYYSVADYQEILQAATARHIQVIPSLDMPGHSRAAIKAMTARYNKYAIGEDGEKAKQYLLHDPKDATQYSSVQYYNDNTINVCLESSYTFVKDVMMQVKAMHAEVGHPLTRYHIGADETAGAWLDSPACKEFVANNDKGITEMSQLGAYFIERVASILSDLDIETAGWSDGLEHTRKENMPAIVQANAWDVLFWGGHKKVHKLTNQNWQIVVSSPDVTYFDFPYEADPKEHGYYWASRHTNTEKVFQFMPDNLPIHAEFWLDREDNPYIADDRLTKDEQGNIVSAPIDKGRKFLGLQGQLWSENTRTDTMVEHKVFPRLLALAERAWYLPQWAVPYNYAGYKYSQETHVFSDESKAQRDAQWQVFAQTLGKKELAKLDLYQVNYRLPTVGAVINEGILKANVAFPGITIEYLVESAQQNNLAAKNIWQTYQQAVPVNSSVKIRTRTSDGSRTGRITQVPYN